MPHTSKMTNRRGHFARAVCAGLAAGFAGSAAKLVGEAIYPPRTRGQKAPPAILAEKILGHSLSSGGQRVASQIFHWTLGTALGAFYGGVSEVLPQATAGSGILFGTLLCLATHESTLPMLGLTEDPREQTLGEHVSEFFTHALYGLTVEAVRRQLLTTGTVTKENKSFIG